jgi:phospholipid/cholesterol/gamma-HCH transport system substrate-binding protein
VREIGDLFRGENADRIERTLINAEAASEEFAARWRGFRGSPGTVDQFTEQINRFNTTLDTVTEELNVVLATANDTLLSIERLADETTVVVARGEGTLDQVDEVVGAAARYIAEDLTATTNELQAARRNLRAELATLGDGRRGADGDAGGNRLHRHRPPAGGGTDAGPGQHASGHARYGRRRGRRGRKRGSTR